VLFVGRTVSCSPARRRRLCGYDSTGVVARLKIFNPQPLPHLSSSKGRRIWRGGARHLHQRPTRGARAQPMLSRRMSRCMYAHKHVHTNGTLPLVPLHHPWPLPALPPPAPRSHVLLVYRSSAYLPARSRGFSGGLPREKRARLESLTVLIRGRALACWRAALSPPHLSIKPMRLPRRAMQSIRLIGIILSTQAARQHHRCGRGARDRAARRRRHHPT
jgi:hypothetical protein